jgi:hypothetical protein
MAAAKTTTRTGKTATDTTKPAIPVAVRPGQTAPAADLLSQLTGNAPAKAKPATKARPTLDLTPEVEEVFRDHVAGKVLYDHFEAHHENKKAELKSLIFPLWIDKVWAIKGKPTNPTLKTTKEVDGKQVPDCEGMYVIQEKFKVGFSSVEEGVQLLMDLEVGFDADTLTQMIQNEIDFSPSVSIHFNKLQNGEYVEKEWVESTAEQKAVAQKALQLLLSIPGTEPLTDEEKAMLIDQKPKTTVKKDFLSRVAGYCKTRDQVAAIFKVITPVEMARGGKFGISDPMNERNTRLISEAGKILGVNVKVADEAEAA